MRKGIITIIILSLSWCSFAQQDPAFSQYFFNLLYINPAYAGTRDFFSGTVISRNQWVGIDGAPATQSLSMHSALPNSNIGLGLQLYNDQAGPIKTTGVSGTFAYRIPVDENTFLSFGLSGSVSALSLSGNEIHINNQADKSFSTTSSSALVPDADFGIYLYKTRFFVGASMTHLLQTKFNINDASSGDHPAKYYRNYFLTMGSVLPVNQQVSFRPSMLFKYIQSAPVVGEVDGCFIFYEKLFVGAGFRSSKRINFAGTDNMLVGIAELEFLRDFRIGYSYDYYLSQTYIYNGGTHEIMLGWDISAHKTKMENPRFF